METPYSEDTSYAPLVAETPPVIQKQDVKDRQKINTILNQAIYFSLLVLVVLICVAFWVAGREQPIIFSLDATRTISKHGKSMTFVWTLIGTILAFATGALFNQLLRIATRQKLAEPGVRLGRIEFWTRLYSRQWMHDHRHGRLKLSVFTVLFAIATGILTSAYTGLITPTTVYVSAALNDTELDLSSDAFSEWFYPTGSNLLANCSSFNTYGRGSNAITLARCGQVKDPLSYVAAGLSAIESEYATYDPTTNVLGLKFNGSTKGVLPHGWNTINYFDTFDGFLQPEIGEYNYTMQQQGLSANVTCQNLGLHSNVTWNYQGQWIVTTTDGSIEQRVYLQNMTFGPNAAAGIEYDSNDLISGDNFVATFSSIRGPNQDIFVLEISSYGSYKNDWKFPNMSCEVAPYLTNTNVTYYNTTALFAANVIDVPGSNLRIPYEISEVTNWLFRTTTQRTGNQIVDSIIALQNTPSYAHNSGVFANVTIDWVSAMELFLQGVVEYEATYARMLMSADIQSANVQPNGFVPINGTVGSWRLGYSGETTPIATLFPLQGFVLVCAIGVIIIGWRTGVKHVSHFDPTNTTHLIVASAIGGRNGGLGALRGENAIHADDRALNLRIEYKDSHGLQEVGEHGEAAYTELQDFRGVSGPNQAPKPALFARRPFMRRTTDR